MVPYRLSLRSAVRHAARSAHTGGSPESRGGDLLDRLRAGIAYERARGCLNMPGREMMFSDFLRDSLASILDADSALVGASREYPSWPVDRRRAYLEDVERALLTGGDGVQPHKRASYYPFVLDIESTGFSVATAHVVELCLLDVLTGDSFVRRARLPENVVMHPAAERVTGIQTEDVRRVDVPTFDAVMNGALEFVLSRTGNAGRAGVEGVQRTPLLVGHNISKYDVPLLNNRMRDLGMEGSLEGFRLFDTLPYSRAVMAGARSHRLSDLYRLSVGGEPRDAHSALGDVLMTRDVLARMAFGDAWEHAAWEEFFERSGQWITRNDVGASGIDRVGGSVPEGRLGDGHDPKESLRRMEEEKERQQKERQRKVSVSVAELLDMEGVDEMAMGEELQASAMAGLAPGNPVSLWTPIKGLGDMFSATDLRLLSQMRCAMVRDLLYCFPKGYLIASVGDFPVTDVDTDQSIVLPVCLEKVQIYRGTFHVLTAHFRCLNYDDLANGDHRRTMHENPVIEYKIFRKGRSAAWAVMNEEKRIKSMGTLFAISGQVSTSAEGKFVLKEKTLEMMDLPSFQRLPRTQMYLKPLYSQRNKASSQNVSLLVKKMLENAGRLSITDPIPLDILDEHGIAGYASSIMEIHRPQSVGRFKHSRSSLAFHELFFMQLRLLNRSKKGMDHLVVDGSPLPSIDLTSQSAAIGSLDFALTDDQKNALRSINEAFVSSRSSAILLQGDVGCGKTIVALLAALAVSSNGQQVALMAPTEVLAEQHIRSLEAFCDTLPPNIRRPTFELLTGSTKPAHKRELLERLASGEIDILVGTHALISDPVKYKSLGLAIVDEQHKFGVEQRAALLSKASPAPHMLNMSATPIPRSLALVLYGEMELIEIQELPPGREPVTTQVWIEEDESTENASTRERLIAEIKSEIQAGGKCFVVCPLIESSAEGSLRTAVSEKERLCSTDELSGIVGLLHGRMSSSEKDQILGDFANPEGTIKALISTTVVEVGVNVPDASLMIVEHAERFGLAQLHQLRGRVGRGSRRSKCILVTHAEESAERLRILEETNDGFLVAEADLENRGSGNVMGTEQAGIGAASDHLWELPRDAVLVSRARQAAAEFLERYGTEEDGKWPPGLAQELASLEDLDISSLPDHLSFERLHDD
jgi:ATP-dependent DNA helicase RecG